ncbi:MAG TPA: tRNA (adenosine(37)-N6)-dimethylallyltransferase MiaA [Tepidisphaeraceae bacterium]|nr:tRNA (adenosine(37)-N6)-dimethylallyltransferase MiaA [Tepidisphaeraceae bacterium]
MTAAPFVYAIIGPTASGKSDLAMELARRLGGEILSVDSMQVYRGMDVGTAKPSPAEQREVRHHGIDLVDPSASFTAARFVQFADGVIANARARRVPLIAVGGTPLYFKVLFEGMFEGPGADETVRARLRDLSNEALHRRLRDADPAAAARIHVNDTKRLVRALEVLELTGQPISSLQREWASPAVRHEARWIGLEWDRDALNRRINARVKGMLAAGWVEEVRALLARYGALSKTASEATGYAELIAHVQGKMSLDDAAEQIKIATRQLARRQMKWFKRFADVQWLPGNIGLDTVIAQVCSGERRS